MTQDIGSGYGAAWGGLAGGGTGFLSGGPAGALVGGASGYYKGGQGGGGSGGGNQWTGEAGYTDQLNQLAGAYGGQQAAQAGSSQAGLIAQLQAGAAGKGPSAAALQMREAMDRAAGAQASAAAGAGGRGVNQGAALRNASNNTAAIQAQGARDTGVMRSNEQLQAIQQLLAARGQDMQLNQFNAQQQNQMTQQNRQSQLQALALAMKAAGPGLINQLIGGGATAMPTFLKGLGGGGDSGGGVGDYGTAGGGTNALDYGGVQGDF